MNSIVWYCCVFKTAGVSFLESINMTLVVNPVSVGLINVHEKVVTSIRCELGNAFYLQYVLSAYKYAINFIISPHLQLALPHSIWPNAQVKRPNIWKLPLLRCFCLGKLNRKPVFPLCFSVAGWQTTIHSVCTSIFGDLNTHRNFWWWYVMVIQPPFSHGFPMVFPLKMVIFHCLECSTAKKTAKLFVLELLFEGPEAVPRRCAHPGLWILQGLL